MTTPPMFPHADFLAALRAFRQASCWPVGAVLPSAIGTVVAAPDGRPTPALDSLIQLLAARQAVCKAASDTSAVADQLRRYQKYAKPGQPSPHVVQLRQQQAAARQASSQSRQAFVQAAAAFVRDAAIALPPRQALEAYITQWIAVQVPGAR